MNVACSLSGLSPFLGATNQETMTNILAGNIDFTDNVWKNISEEAKDWISKLLIKEKKYVSMSRPQPA